MLVNFVRVLASRIICSSDEYWFKAALVDLVVFPWCLLVKTSFPSPSVLESCSSHMCRVSRFLLLHLYLRRVLLCCFKRFLATVSWKGSGLSKGFLCKFRGFGSRLAVSAK